MFKKYCESGGSSSSSEPPSRQMKLTNMTSHGPTTKSPLLSQYNVFPATTVISSKLSSSSSNRSSSSSSNRLSTSSSKSWSLCQTTWRLTDFLLPANDWLSPRKPGLICKCIVDHGDGMMIVSNCGL